MQKIQVDYSHENTVCRVVLNDGKGNVLDNVMMTDLLNLCDELQDKPNIKLITFEGEGKHFSFGASVEEHTKEKAGAMLGSFHQIFYKLVDLGIPTMAKITGQCLGGGLELALVCNVLFADNTARMGQPEIVLGVFPPLASIMLPLRIGHSRAEELLISGRTIGGEEAERLGILNQVFEDQDQMNSKAEGWITNNIVPKSASSLRFAVKAARKVFNHILLNKLPELEKEYLDNLMESKDANEGIQAFIEKRQPVWDNC